MKTTINYVSVKTGVYEMHLIGDDNSLHTLSNMDFGHMREMMRNTTADRIDWIVGEDDLIASFKEIRQLASWADMVIVIPGGSASFHFARPTKYVAI